MKLILIVQVLYFKYFGPLEYLHCFSQHVCRDDLQLKIIHPPFCHTFTIPQDAQSIAQLEHFFHLMGNQHNGNTLLLQISYQIIENGLLCFRQAGGGFIQKQNLRIGIYTFRNFYQLLLGQGQGFHLNPRIYGNRQTVQKLLHLMMASLPVNETSVLEHPVSHNILSHCHFTK